MFSHYYFTEKDLFVYLSSFLEKAIPIHWTARIETVTETGFSDRQMRGPFAFWLHRHTFAAVNEQTTEVVDEITVKLSHHPLWWLVGMFMWLGLPFLFAYRGWKTKRMLK